MGGWRKMIYHDIEVGLKDIYVSWNDVFHVGWFWLNGILEIVDKTIASTAT